MSNDLINNINDIAVKILDDKRFNTLNNLESMWNELDELFKEWENKIENVHAGKGYITDQVENEFKEFAWECTKYIVGSMGVITTSNHKIMKFFGHRHAGYGFFASYEALKRLDKDDEKQIIHSYEKILTNTEYRNVLYFSLVQYFLNFYGNFSDNEMAIRMLCKYYSDDLEFDEEMQEVLASTLFSHIKIAGTPRDSGFAFDGISEIAKGIGKLSTKIIDKILKKYDTYMVINDKVYRNQIYTIIKYSKIKESEKFKYKFFFIDSIWIANVISLNIYMKYKSKNEEINLVNWQSKSFAESELPIYEKENNTDKCFWTYENYDCRYLKLGKDAIVKISLNNKIYIKLNYKTKIIDFSFDDWMLNKYDTSRFDYELREFTEILNNNSKYSPENRFLFSYIYVNGHRGVEHQHLSFDHKYKLDEKDYLSILDDNNNLQFGNFYGRNIYSLSCIIGKNGTGKTSILEFLRKFFFVIIYLIEQGKLKLNKGIVNIEQDITIENSVLKKETEFLVIFNFNSKSYMITNMKNVHYDKNKILPYNSGLLAMKNDNSKVIYFSNMIDINDTRLINTDNERKMINEGNLMKSLQGFRNVDYSENSSYIKKLQSILQTYKDKNLTDEDVGENSINYDFIYQITFLNSHNDDELIKWFGANFNKSKLTCDYLEENDLFEEVFSQCLEENFNDIFSDKAQTDLFKSLAGSFQTQIKYFSSGQYVKFSFLSKLYWCLKGFNDYQGLLEKVFGMNRFYVQDTIQENDTAIIFIDEGELYYHPEWQRTYISTLIDFINSYSSNIQIQIVMTTNSPFIISDISTNDIMYLPCNNNFNCVTFGQNIHTLLKNNLFMDYTIGEFARNRIEFIIKQISKQGNNKYKSKNKIVSDIKKVFNISIHKNDIYKFLKNLIELIGEEIYRVKLLSMLDECMLDQSELEKLEQKKLEIERKIEKIKNDSNI